MNYYKEYSYQLNREMEFKVYGTKGKPCLVIPSQDGRFYDFEDFHMVDACRSFIDNGQLQLFCVDTIDQETLSANNKSIRERMEQHERWFWYLIEEFYPQMLEINHSQMEESQWKLPMTAGCSMGAYHAANLFFRRPDFFDAVISMSGFYHLKTLIGDYMDDLVYFNSPYDSISGMGDDHPYRSLYARSQIILCIGQGPWEDELLKDTREFDGLLHWKGIPAWVDYWGYDSAHDWAWWRKQWEYFLSHVC